MATERRPMTLGQLSPRLVIVVLCRHYKVLVRLRLLVPIRNGRTLAAWEAEMLDPEHNPVRQVVVPRDKLLGTTKVRRTMERASHYSLNPPDRLQTCTCVLRLS